MIAGTVKAEKQFRSSAGPSMTEGHLDTPFTQPLAAGGGPVLASPGCLPQEALKAMLERGVVGTVACVLD